MVKEVILDAPVNKVWNALTEKEQLKQWSFDMNDFKPEAGFHFEFYGEKDGEKFLHLCEVLEAEKEKKMKWLWTYKDVPGITYVTFELFPEGDKTRLRLKHDGLETLPQDDNYAMQNFNEGWNALLNDMLPKMFK